MTTIKFVDELGTEIETKMRRDLEKYENRHGIDVNYKQFALVLTDKYDNAIGILNAFTAFAEISVCYLWVDISHRRKGYGRQLLQFLEDHFKDKGFNNINLINSQFQAPEFYKKYGFELEFVRKNMKNPNLTKSFFIKYFDDEIQTLGTLPKA